MAISVRAACMADVGALVRLNRDVQQLHVQLEPKRFRADADDGEVAAFFAAKLAASENQIRLAGDGGGQAGYVWFEVQERPETPFTFSEKRIYIHHLAVQVTARRHGIASALISQVETEAAAAGIESVVLGTWANNKVAHRFFEACGFAPVSLVLRKSLA